MPEERKLIRPGAEVEFGADVRHWEEPEQHAPRYCPGRVQREIIDTG